MTRHPVRALPQQHLTTEPGTGSAEDLPAHPGRGSQDFRRTLGGRKRGADQLGRGSHGGPFLAAVRKDGAQRVEYTRILDGRRDRLVEAVGYAAHGLAQYLP